ncbi:myomesin-2 isoform X1 [Oncorhynchus mykiss]|uniref:Myomesin 2 n=2 Tax=Oncorhynchus mykiss TaxID=8022 RepID=A0A8K9UDC2_ONCMY|nr:myomesin-2 isoform X1 [Oncorhynchus mykiss]
MAATVARHKHVYVCHDCHSAQSKVVAKQYTSSEVVEDDYHHKQETRIQGVVRKKMVEKYVREESMIRGPQFLTTLRSHTVWEHTPVKLYCTVEGYPTPLVKWYKDGVSIDMSSIKYNVQDNVGIHTLEIAKCETDDTAQYTAMAGNIHGQVSTQASVIVKRIREEGHSSSYAWLPYTIPMLPEIKYTKINITFLETFGSVFGTEGDTVTLAATTTATPNLTNLQPEAQWFRDDHRLSDSKWVKIESARGETKLTLPHLNKDDEGVYTLRMVTKGGDAVHSAFVSCADGPPPVPGAPGAPMDIKIHDANRDYVIVSWKPPNTTTEGPIIGYFVDRCETGTENWVQCNDSPIKICKYPVPGLFEGHSYYFRVRAINSHGISKPSRISDPIAALDPTEFERLHAIKLGGKLDVVIYHDDVEDGKKVPGTPSKLYASETDRTYVVLSWKPAPYQGQAPVWYYIEKCLAESGAWQRVNTQVPVRSPRYAVFDLSEGKQYLFRVLAANMYGSSEASEPTEPIQTQELHGVPSAPGQVVATRETDTSLLIQWAEPKEPNNLIGYYIDVCVKGSKDWGSANHKPHKNNKFVVQGLTTGETYAFRVQAINELGLSDESQESSPLSVKAALTTPSAPYDIALLACDGESMVLNWKHPVHSGGSPVVEYYIDKHRHGEHTWREINIPPIKERLFKVEHLSAGAVYEFMVYGGSLAGLGAPSAPSKAFHCDAWTIPEPGPAYDMTFCEIRDDSVLVEWKAPVYTGASPITGYFVDFAKKGSDEWHCSNESHAVSHRYHKVTGLEVGVSYVFRVRAANAEGAGKPSLASNPVVAKAVKGAQEMTCTVDEESGDLILSFESCQITESSHFVWKKFYKEITDFSKGIVIKTEGNISKLIFKHPDQGDMGCFSVAVTNTDGVSASHEIHAEELEKMLAKSYGIRHPVIPLKTQLAYKILERGRMRFWLQAEHISSAVTYKFLANNNELSPTNPNHASHDVEAGIIEFVLDHFTEDSEGTFTVQIEDGKARGQSSLVLVGADFKAALADAEHQRSEYVRVKDGPHFSEFLSVHVGDDCSVALICKVDNLKKETALHWFKDGVEITPEGPVNLASGTCKLPISLFSKASTGIYKATISDDRGKHQSQIEISGHAFDEIINKLSKLAGSSATELAIHCTATGIQLQCHMKYYTEEMKIHWLHVERKLSHSEKVRIGGTPAMATMEIIEPTDKDKGLYHIQIIDTDKTYTRTIDLSGNAYDKAFAEFTTLKEEAYAEAKRGKVLGGLPDVVTIMEKKTLSLTCTVCGDPKPQVTWLKNGAEVYTDDQYLVSLESGKFASLTIKRVSLEDCGRYTMTVQNKYGGESVDIVVSAYKHGDTIPQAKPTLTPKSIIPPKRPIEIPGPKVVTPAPSPAPSHVSSPAGAKSPTSPKGLKSPTPARSMKSPTPTRRK